MHVDGLRKGERKEQKTTQETVLIQSIVDLQNKLKSDGSFRFLYPAHSCTSKAVASLVLTFRMASRMTVAIELLTTTFPVKEGYNFTNNTLGEPQENQHS